jgi:hypothetical protein
MTSPIGIWIDHRKAVIAELLPDGSRLTIIDSTVEKHLQRGGDSPLHGRYEAQQVPADDKQQRALTGELNHYYDRIIAALPHKDGLYLFGPGEAKGELLRRLLKANPHAEPSIETTDKLTDRQIVAAVRKHFGKYGSLVATRDCTMDRRPVNHDSRTLTAHAERLCPLKQ